MNVKKYKISITDKPEILLPFSQKFDIFDNNEIIENELVQEEKLKAINPVIDNETARYFLYNPINTLEQIINKITINLFFYNRDNDSYDFTYGSNALKDGKFSDDDLKFRSNSFTNSFLRLSFYDSPNTSDRNLVYTTTIRNQVIDDHFDLIPSGNPNKPIKKIKKAIECKSTLRLYNPFTKPEFLAEGFNLFWFKKDELVFTSGGREIYMVATYNNAKTGKTVNMVSKKMTGLLDRITNSEFGIYNNIKTKLYYEDKIGTEPGFATNYYYEFPQHSLNMDSSIYNQREILYFMDELVLDFYEF